jgi:hypothetical protein
VTGSWPGRHGSARKGHGQPYGVLLWPRVPGSGSARRVHEQPILGVVGAQGSSTHLATSGTAATRCQPIPHAAPASLTSASCHSSCTTITCRLRGQLLPVFSLLC